MAKKKKYSKIAQRVKELIEEHILMDYDILLEEEYSAGNKLRYDFCFPYLSEMVAFEADGIQHDKFVPFFHKTKEGFEESKNRDKLKDFTTTLRGGIVIRIKNEKITDKEFLELINPYIYIFKEGDVNIPKYKKR